MIALCAATGMVALSALPGAAQAAPDDTVTIVSAGNPAGQPSLLQITATATTDITTITAQLTPTGGGTAYAVPTLTPSSGSLMDGTWSVTIPSGAITAGNYTIEVSASDMGGGSVTDDNAGTLAYLYQPLLTANDSVATVDYNQQTVTFSGVLTAVPPDGSTGPVPEEGVSVYYEAAGSSTPQVITSTLSDGSYSATVPVTGDGWYIGTDATDTVAAAQSSELSYGPVQTQVNNINITPSTLTYGETATLTGTVNFGYGTGVVANGPVEIIDGSTTLPTVLTNSAGQFSATFNTADGDNMQITTGTGNDLLTATGIGLSFSVPWPLKSKMFTAKIDGEGYVISSICLQTSPPNFSPIDPSSVELQYAAKPGGPWQELGMLPGLNTHAKNCDGVGGWNLYTDIEEQIPSRLLNAYYRVVVPAGANEAFTGPVVHSSISRSRIESFNVRPRSVSTGDTVTISGVLQKHGKSWTGYARRKVDIIVWPRHHKKEAGLLFVLRTNGSGHFSRSFGAGTARGKFDFAAIFYGSSKYLWSESKTVLLRYNSGAAATLPSGAWWLGIHMLHQGRLAPLPRWLSEHLLAQPR